MHSILPFKFARAQTWFVAGRVCGTQTRSVIRTADSCDPLPGVPGSNHEFIAFVRNPSTCGFRGKARTNFLYLRVFLPFWEYREFRTLRSTDQGFALTTHHL